MKNALKKIIYNCKQATFLIEKRAFGKISAAEALQLQVHLAGCSVCRTFQQQSLLINRLFAGFQPDEFSLDEDFKTGLKQRIKKEMKKK